MWWGFCYATDAAVILGEFFTLVGICLANKYYSNPYSTQVDESLPGGQSNKALLLDGF